MDMVLYTKAFLANVTANQVQHYRLVVSLHMIISVLLYKN